MWNERSDVISCKSWKSCTFFLSLCHFYWESNMCTIVSVLIEKTIRNMSKFTPKLHTISIFRFQSNVIRRKPWFTLITNLLRTFLSALFQLNVGALRGLRVALARTTSKWCCRASSQSLLECVPLLFVRSFSFLFPFTFTVTIHSVWTISEALVYCRWK